MDYFLPMTWYGPLLLGSNLLIRWQDNPSHLSRFLRLYADQYEVDALELLPEVYVVIQSIRQWNIRRADIAMNMCQYMRWQTDRMTEYKFSRSDSCLFYIVHHALDKWKLFKWPLIVVIWTMLHRRTSSATNSLWKAGPWSVWMTTLSNMEAVSAAIVDLVGNSSTYLEKASMITRIYSLPFESLWSRWRTSNGLFTGKLFIGKLSEFVGGCPIGQP
jgi:hypothetical protein